MVRLFISVEIPGELKAKISRASSDFKRVIEGNFVKQDDIHLTMKFIGYVDNSKLGEIKDKLSSIDFSAFVCELVGIGAFPRETSPRVLWAGVGRGSENLVELSDKINNNLASVGFERDTRFHPHATFCRVKHVNNKRGLAKLIEKYKSRKFGEFKVEKFNLMESRLSRSGPSYSSLGVFKAP